MASAAAATVRRGHGHHSVVTFRQNFSATYATTPTSYRQRFSASLT